VASRSAETFNVISIRTDTIEEARLIAQSHFTSSDDSHQFTSNNEQYIFTRSPKKSFICVGMIPKTGNVSYAILRNEKRQETIFLGGGYQACYLDADPSTGISITANPPPDDYTKNLLAELK